MDIRYKRLKLNSILALFYQAILIITGLVLPRCFLKYYGSEVNGLVSSITQFLIFINLCDMGISAVVSSAYYKPLADKNIKNISNIFAASKKFFRNVSYIMIVYVVILVVIYPSFVKGDFSRFFTISLLLSMCISQFGQYFIGISYQILLNADQKSYVQLIINGVTLVINAIVAIIAMKLGYSIQTVKLFTSMIYLARPILMYWYVKNNYEIDKNINPSKDAIPQKWSGVVQHISYMIYENTDIAVLTIFSTLTNVSIYSVYVLIVGSIRTFINAATTGVQALFGNMIASREQNELNKIYELYDWGIHTISTLLFSITGIMIIPFVLIYTKGINDANYNVRDFSIVITIAYAVNMIRNAMYVLIRSAGHYKETQAASLLEATINLVISVIFVFKFGLIGVAIGTLAATSFFVIYEVVYLSKKIIWRPIKKFVKQLLVDLLSVGIMIITTSSISVDKLNYLSWAYSAVKVGCICVIVCGIIQYVFYSHHMQTIINKIYRK